MKPTADTPAKEIFATAWQDEAPDLGVLKRWLHENTRLGPHRTVPAVPCLIHDTYLDTPDLRILRAGYALRIRRAAGAATASLVEPAPRDGGGERREITQPLAPAREATFFGERGPVVDRLQAICREDELVTLARVRTERRAYRVVHGAHADVGDPAAAGGGPGAEVTLDRSLLTDASGHTHRRSYLNLAVAHAGDPAFRLLADRLRGEYGPRGAKGAAESAAAWAIRAAGVRVDGTRPPGAEAFAEIERAMSVQQAADTVLRRHLASFLWHEPGTRLGDDPERLHDMRVACRRLRAALKLFRPVYPGEEADRLRRRLGDFGRCLGEVRDFDVFIDDVRERSGGLRSLDPAAADPLLLHLERERARARERLREALDSPEFAVLKRDLAGLRPCPLVGPSVGSLPRFAARVVRRARGRVRRLARDLAPDSPAADFHRLRIGIKRLRYSLEFFEDLYGAAAKNLLQGLVDAQDLLGRHQDAQVSVEKLRRIAVEEPAGFNPAGWLALGELMRIHLRRAKKLRRRLPLRMRRLERKRWPALGRAMKRMSTQTGAPASEDTGRELPAATTGQDPAGPPIAVESPLAGVATAPTRKTRGKSVGH